MTWYRRSLSYPDKHRGHLRRGRILTARGVEFSPLRARPSSTGCKRCSKPMTGPEKNNASTSRGHQRPPRRINEIVHGKRGITADTALRLARFFGTTERFWLNLQGRYDLEIEKERLSADLDRIEPLRSA